MRLGLSIAYIVEGICHCGNGVVGGDGFHLLSQCALSAQQKINTHNAVRDVWWEMAKHAGLTVDRECSKLLQQIDPTTSKRMDLVFQCFDGTLPLLADVGIVDPRILNTDNYADGTEREYIAGSAASVRERQKQNKYKELIPAVESDKVCCAFKAPIMECFGSWGVDSRYLFKDFIGRIVAIEGGSKAQHSAFWKARLSFAMHKTAAQGMQTTAHRHALRFEQLSDELPNLHWEQFLVCRT